MNTQLPTDWNFLSVGLSPGPVAQVVNEIIMPYDGSRTTIFSLGTSKLNNRINRELERRGINYRIAKCYATVGLHLLTNILLIPVFIEMHQIAVALNLLSEDYNARGC